MDSQTRNYYSLIMNYNRYIKWHYIIVPIMMRGLQFELHKSHLDCR